MKKVLLLATLFLGIGIHTAKAQYTKLNYTEPDFSPISSSEGITVISITPNQDGAYTVVLFNGNRGYIEVAYNFEWYLSYKGKRVSDYYQESIHCTKSLSKTVYAWPDEIPEGNEKYVTVQFGRRPAIRDRRDDD